MRFLFLGAVATGAGFLTQTSAKNDDQKPAPVAQPAAPAAKPDGPIRKPAPGRMFVTGVVLDPQRRPVANATTMVYARSKEPGRGENQNRLNLAPLGQAEADGAGRFQLDTPRTSSSRNDRFGALALAPVMASAGLSSILTPNNPQPRSSFAPSK